MKKLFFICFSPLFAFAQKTIENPQMILPGHSGDVDAIAVSVRGEIATGSWDKKINIYKDDSTFALIKSFDAHLAPVTALEYSKDGGLLASGANDYSIRIWDSTYKAFRVLDGHKGNVNALLFDASRRYLLSGSDDRNIIVWDVASGKQLAIINNGKGVNALLQNPASPTQLIVAGAEPQIKIYSMKTRQVKEFLTGHTDIVNAIAINKKGTLLLSGSNDKSARIWDLKTRKEIRKLPVDCWKVMAVAFSEDGIYAMTGCNDGSTKVWEVATGKLVVNIEGTGNYVRDLNFSRTTNKLLTANMLKEGSDFGLRVWDAELETLPISTEENSATEKIDSSNRQLVKPHPTTPLKNRSKK